MKLIFYIFVFSQLFNLFDVFAEKIKKEPSESKIQWERFRDKKSNNLKKIIWKSYNNDATYFKNINKKENNSNKILFKTKNEKINLNIKKKEIRSIRNTTTYSFK